MGRTIGQTNKITAIGSNYFDLETPVHYDYKYMMNPATWNYSARYQKAGVESLALDRKQSGSGTGSNIYFDGCINCWVRNVKSLNVWNWHVDLEGNYGSVIRDSWFEQTWQLNCGGNACYGAAIYGRTSDSLVENNVFVHLRHSLITEYGGQANIFGYNYSRQPINENGLSTDYLMGDMTTHGGQPMFNLWEGNIAGIMRFDQVLGSSRFNTAFRNNIEVKAVPATIVGMFAVDIQLGNLYENILGNIFGSSGIMGTATRLGCEQDTCSGTASYNASISLPDARVAATTLLHGNYDWNASSTSWDAGNSNHTLPNSFYRSSQPSWWDTSPWPGIGPDLGAVTLFGSNGLNGSNPNPAYTRYIASTTPPVISSIASSTTATTATITWTTDKVASSTVRYGASSSYGSASSSSAYVTSHSVTLTGLTANTAYHFRVESGDPDNNYATSSDKTFTTSSGGPSAPTVTAQAASSLTNASATLNGTITATGGDNPSVRGFAYGTASNLSTVISTSTESGSFSTGAFTGSASSLACNTTYYFRPYATNSGGTGYGSITSFTTSACAAPTVVTSSASSIGQTSANLNGSISVTGGNNATQSGFTYGTSSALLTGVSTTTLGAQTGAASFSSSISSLICETTYYFRAYATNVTGTGFGSVVSFTAASCAAPASPSSGSSSGSRPSSQTSAARRAANLASSDAAPSSFARPVLLPTLSTFIEALIAAGVIPADKAQEARAAINAAPASSVPPAGLQYHDQGEAVKSLQETLAQKGYLAAAPNGVFGPATLAALKRFQAAHGVPATGYYGPLTQAAMNSTEN
ncbi:MAG TPA: peptidoglycan-binding protein [Candidatus Paceibacterota bacterium]|nr:peptidoglycan-binding protein [Candidatus Paceibacterota bacterium]